MSSDEAARIRQLFVAFHEERRDLDEDALDNALGLPSQAFRWAADQAASIQAQHPGESTVNVPTPYAVCRGLFQELQLSPSDRVFDLGCAAGRVLLYGALVTGARFRGVELVRARAQQGIDAARRLGLTNVQIVVGNVLDENLGDADVFYLFRPFSVETEALVIARLHEQARERPITVATSRLQPSLFDAELFQRVSFGTLVLHRSRPHGARSSTLT